MRLILNTAIGGNFLTNPNSSTVWPQEFQIDYVHAYTKSGDRTLTIENGGFEDNGGSLAHWSKFGNVINNVSSGNQQVGSGQEALKLFGQFNGENNYSGITQGLTVTAGEELTASASAFIASNDSIAGSGNIVQLKIDYFNKQHGQFGSADFIGADEINLANGSTVNNQWFTRELISVAPAGAVEARVVIVFGQRDNAGGAVFVDDVNLSQVEPEVLLGDVNRDTNVNFLDISPFIALLSSGEYQVEADINEDGFVNFFDISPFIALLSSG